MSMDKKRWLILAACCLINLCIGSLYAWSVFAGPLAENLNALRGLSLTPGDLAAAFTVANLISPITLIGGGFVNDKLGPKWVVFAGGLLFGAGMVLTGLSTTLTGVMLSFGIVVGLGMGVAYGSTVSTSVKFFPDKRGVIGGITVAAYGLSSVVVPPLANALIGAFGITRTMVALGVGMGAVVCLCALLLQKCPEGYAPAGWQPKPAANGAAPLAANKNWRGMLADPIFYVMLLMLVCGGFFGLMTISQAATVAREMVGMETAAATLVVSVLALFNAAGRVICGLFSDRVGRVNVLTGALVLALAALLLLYFSGGTASFVVGICLVGFCFGAFMGVYPGFTADMFGALNNGVNYGIMFIGFATAGVVGPVLMNGIHQGTGSYRPAFLLAAGIAALGLVFCFVYHLVAARTRAPGRLRRPE